MNITKITSLGIIGGLVTISFNYVNIIQITDKNIFSANGYFLSSFMTGFLIASLSWVLYDQFRINPFEWIDSALDNTFDMIDLIRKKIPKEDDKTKTKPLGNGRNK